MEQQEVFVLVLVPRGQEFLSKMILGRSVDDWVKQAVLQMPAKRVQVGPGDDILTIVKRHGMHHRWTVVIYADMPLIMEECLREAATFAEQNNHKVLRLPRGWLFDTEHIKSGGEIAPAAWENCNPEHFISVFNAVQLDKARKEMQRRINVAHMNNGVEIEDITSTFIDATVEIEPGAKILPFTKVSGNVKIEQGATIGPFAHIRDDGKVIEEKKKEEEPPKQPPEPPKPVLKKLEVEIVEAPPPPKPKPKPEPEPEPEVEVEPEPEPEVIEEIVETEEDFDEDVDMQAEEEISYWDQQEQEEIQSSVKFDWDNMKHDSFYEGRD